MYFSQNKQSIPATLIESGANVEREREKQKTFKFFVAFQFTIIAQSENKKNIFTAIFQRLSLP